MESEKGKGTAFTFSVRVKVLNEEEARETEAVVEEKEDNFPQGINLLIVEDSAPIRKMLKRILERAGFSVDEAGNGEQGLDKLTRTSYDVCIMDFLMPIMDGVTCTRKYRAWEAAAKRKRTVIVGSSANADETEINSALGGGFFDGFIPKPVTTATLKAKLDELYAAQ